MDTSTITKHPNCTPITEDSPMGLYFPQVGDYWILIVDDRRWVSIGDRWYDYSSNKKENYYRNRDSLHGTNARLAWEITRDMLTPAPVEPEPIPEPTYVPNHDKLKKFLENKLKRETLLCK
jgi:hypothetical protein